MKANKEYIRVYGAKEHNLKNVYVDIPRNELVVVTGISGSGKSSLAFDTIFAEGQRRYLETLSSYARQFIGSIERPDVEKIDGLSPVISIEQKTVSKSPRSTVGTITEIYDFIRLLYARVSTAYSYNTGEKMVKYTDKQISKLILKTYQNKRIILLAPKVIGRKGHYRELFEQIRKQGYTKVRVDGEIKEIEAGMKLDRYSIHDIEIVIDRIVADKQAKERLSKSVDTAMRIGANYLMVMDYEDKQIRHFSRNLMCAKSGISYPDPEPNLFSFNSPYGACSSCNGLGYVSDLDLLKIIPDKSKNMLEGAFVPLGKHKKTWIFEELEELYKVFKTKTNTPVKKLSKQLLDVILYGTKHLESGKESEIEFEGIWNFILRHHKEGSPSVRRWAAGFMKKKKCKSCNGYRLKKEAYFFKINNKHIGDLANMDLDELSKWFDGIESHLDEKENRIANELLKEIRSRLSFALNVGLNYLSLNRSAKTLSGGEAQRIRLATQIGSELMNVIYILDEPSIGLHQRDNTRLINALKALRDFGNTILVVEHDKEMMENADTIVEIGPGAGVHGGEIMQLNHPKKLDIHKSITAPYIKGMKTIPIPKQRRAGNGKFISILKASGNNLKEVDLKIPLGTFSCISGVSGSGKSSLINETLVPALMNLLHGGNRQHLPFESIEGHEHIDKLIEIDQSPIGRTPRSNPATYTKVFDEIRMLFASLQESQIRGYKPGRFSFNVSGGKCESCNGAGLEHIEMNFLPDVYVKCDTCQGLRYNRETLEVRYKGKSISDVLSLTVEDAKEFFASIPKIKRTMDTLYDVGLGYIQLGQSSVTLSGGEAQRIKLASELSKKSTKKTLYILDEPSTGLHFEDIQMLLNVLNKLVDEGNSVVVIEHNLDILKTADYLIDLGKEGGKNGGQIIAKGTPEFLVKEYKNKSFTAKYLEKELIA